MQTPENKPDSGKPAFPLYYLAAGIPLLFLLLILFIFSPLAGLLVVLLLVVGAGLLYRKKPELFAFLKRKKAAAPSAPTPSAPLSNSIRDRHKKSYMSLVSINAANQQIILVNKTPFTVGRDAGCDHVLDYSQVSRIHITITYDESAQLCYVQDQSSNGTFLNGRRLLRGNRTALHQRDTLQISGVIFSVEYAHF